LLVITNPNTVFGQGLEDWQQEELRPLMERVTSVYRSEVPADNAFEISVDFLKGGTDEDTGAGLIFVPFTLQLNASALSMSEFLTYLLVVPHTDPATRPVAAAPAGPRSSNSSAAAATDPNIAEELFESRVFEDVFFISVSDVQSDDDELLSFDRAFQAPAGTYDAYIVVRDSVGEDGDRGDLSESAIIVSVEQIEVPDYWNGEMATSSIIAAADFADLGQPLSPEEQRTQPYTFNTTQFVPKRDRDYLQAEDALTLLFFVYNSQLDGDQVNVTVGFDFYTVNAAGESFFNRTAPQEFNAQTLPAGFDAVNGGIPSQVSIPLAGFPASEYRLEIKVTDNANEQTLAQDFVFSVNE
tara:strand:- start:13190 stop:14254 length:1065 start_codon:yes stop_codon:yes gene_type:complete